MTVERSLLPGSNQHGGACEALRDARCIPAEPKLAAVLGRGERGRGACCKLAERVERFITRSGRRPAATAARPPDTETPANTPSRPTPSPPQGQGAHNIMPTPPPPQNTP